MRIFIWEVWVEHGVISNISRGKKYVKLGKSTTGHHIPLNEMGQSVVNWEHVLN